MYKQTKIHQLVSCEGKRRFSSYSEAQHFLKAKHNPRKKKIHKSLGVYKCDFRAEGHHFHIGNNKLG